MKAFVESDATVYTCTNFILHRRCSVAIDEPKDATKLNTKYEYLERYEVISMTSVLEFHLKSVSTVEEKTDIAAFVICCSSLLKIYRVQRFSTF